MPLARNLSDSTRRASKSPRLARARSNNKRLARSGLESSPTSCGNGSIEPVRLSQHSAPPSSSRHSSMDSPNISLETNTTTARQQTPAAPYWPPSNSCPLRQATTAAAPAPTASETDVSDMARPSLAVLACSLAACRWAIAKTCWP